MCEAEKLKKNSRLEDPYGIIISDEEDEDRDDTDDDNNDDINRNNTKQNNEHVGDSLASNVSDLSIK